VFINDVKTTFKWKTGRIPPGVANPIDVNVGTRLSLARHMSSLSQETLGAAEGLTFQQIQEYERGSNRIGTSRLYQCAEFLNLTGYFFFEEIPDEIKSLECVYKKGMMDSEQSDIDVDPLSCRKTIYCLKIITTSLTHRSGATYTNSRKHLSVPPNTEATASSKRTNELPAVTALPNVDSCCGMGVRSINYIIAVIP
jgi:transcriptional regulator with XRE-family HTH domain